MSEQVNHPQHYNAGKIEAIDVIGHGSPPRHLSHRRIGAHRLRPHIPHPRADRPLYGLRPRGSIQNAQILCRRGPRRGIPRRRQDLRQKAPAPISPLTAPKSAPWVSRQPSG